MRVTKDELRDIISPLIERFRAYVDKRVGEIPAGKDGLPGKDGADGKDGAPGAPGAPGKDGADGSPGKDGRDGVDGKDGADGLHGKDGAPGANGRDGADGKSVTPEDLQPMLEAAFSKWALDFERRAADVLQRAAERIPTPKDGIDGMGIEDLQVEHDGDGLVTLKFSRGEVSRGFTIRLPRFKDRGVFREDENYREGDGVSFGGSLWLAQKDGPTGRPGDTPGEWRLAVKKGRDGRDGGGSAPTPRGPVRMG